MNTIQQNLIVWLSLLSASLSLAQSPEQLFPERQQFIDLSAMDTTISPCEDFFRYVNGTWLATAEIPPQKNRWGAFPMLFDENQKRTRIILEEAAQNAGPKGSVLQRVGDFYASGMDSLTVEQTGYQELKPVLEALEEVQTYPELLTFGAQYYHDLNIQFPFIIQVEADNKNNNFNIVHLYEAGMFLPEKEYYIDHDEQTKKVRKAYENYAAQLLRFGGSREATALQQARRLIEMETKLAASHFTAEQRRDIDLQYNKYAIADLSQMVPHLQLEVLLSGFGLQKDSLIVQNPAYYRALDSLIHTESLEDWKLMTKISILHNYAPYLNHDFVKAEFAFQQALHGTVALKDRWMRVQEATDKWMGELLGQLYVKKHFPPEAKQRMLILVENIRRAFASRIQKLDWMQPQTKQKALEKLSRMVVKIGYPDKWKDYEGVVIDRQNYLANVRALKKWAVEEMLQKINQPVDRTEWYMTPMTVNAYQNFVYNEMVYPAGILQWPFFDPQADDAINYGGIGLVIGHEITHGFDDQGRKFDKTGKQQDWWDSTDQVKFTEKTQLLRKQFDEYKILDTVSINGQLTLGENIADLGGLAVAYDAFKLTEQWKQGQMMDGFTPDQRFFMSFAQIWRIKEREETQRFLAKSDPHAPAEFRANSPLSNFEPFYKAFGVKPGDPMYRPKEEQAKIW